MIKPFMGEIMLLIYLVFHQQNLLTYTDGSAHAGENTSRYTGRAVALDGSAHGMGRTRYGPKQQKSFICDFFSKHHSGNECLHFLV